MSKFIKNNTVSTQQWIGIEIAAGVYSEIEEVELETYQQDEEFLAAVTSGDAIIARDNTGATDITDVTRAFQFLFDKLIIEDSGVFVTEDAERINFTSSLDVAVDSATNTTTVELGPTNSNVGSLIQMTFGYHSTAKNKWLNYIENPNGSDKVHALMPWDARLIRATLSNSKKGADTDIEIHVAPNGDGNLTSIAYTWAIRNKRVACTSPSVDFDAGDKLGLFAKDQGTDLKNVTVTLYFVILTDDACVDEDYSGNFSSSGSGTSSS